MSFKILQCIYSWFFETTTTLANYFHFAHCSLLWSVFITFLSQQAKIWSKESPLKSMYCTEFLIMQLKKQWVWQYGLSYLALQRHILGREWMWQCHLLSFQALLIASIENFHPRLVHHFCFLHLASFSSLLFR